MGPVTKHLRAVFPELPDECIGPSSTWTFHNEIGTLGADFYNKVLPLHPILNVEYSILCNQIRQGLLKPEQSDQTQAIKRWVAALTLSQLLEHVHLHYLCVPREVARLRRQQEVLKTLLTQVGYSFDSYRQETVDAGLSLAAHVRDNTVFFHAYRILLTRSKRFLNVLNTVLTETPVYNSFIAGLDTYTNPFFNHLSWLFNLPRLLVNTFLLFKHVLPGMWMEDKERSLAWTVRLIAQIQRRWFELGNDWVWVGAGALNVFILIGVLAPAAFYVSLAAFAFDVLNAAVRAFVELNRLYSLRADYTQLLQETEAEEEQEELRDYLSCLENRLYFEQLRFGLNVTNMALICAAMTVATPIFALSPVIILASVAFLLLIWAINFILAAQLESYRPQEELRLPLPMDASSNNSDVDTVSAEVPLESTSCSVSQLGFFGQKNTITQPVQKEDLLEEGSCFFSNCFFSRM